MDRVIDRLHQYHDGMNMGELNHIRQISDYNHNFYVGLCGDLLFATCEDDENTTLWYLVKDCSHYFIGVSGTDDLLVRVIE